MLCAIRRLKEFSNIAGASYRFLLWPQSFAQAVLTVVIVMLPGCPRCPKTYNPQPGPSPDDGYVELLVTPDGGTFALGEGGLLRVATGAVDEPTAIRVRTLAPTALNRLLYKRNIIAQHYAGSTIGSTTYTGSEPWMFAAGVEIQPSGIDFKSPIQLELPTLPGAQPTTPLQVKVDESRDALLVQPGTVVVRPISNPTSPHPDIVPIMHTLQFEITETSAHAVVERTTFPEWIDCAAVDRSDPVVWATACRACGRFTVEQGTVAYEMGQCAVQQLTTRVTFHDCPGSPVEEHTQQILAPECGEMEPIEDILNYRPGKTWLFQFRRTRVKPASMDERQCAGDQTVHLSVDGEVTILPEEDVEGNQAMEGIGSLIFSATQEGCLIPQKYQLDDGASGPLSVPVEVSGELHWWSYVERPGGSISLLIRSELEEQADFIFTRERHWDVAAHMWGPWENIKVPLHYERIIAFLLPKEFIPYSLSRTYGFNEQPWPYAEFLILDKPDSSYFLEPPHRYTDQFSLAVEH